MNRQIARAALGFLLLLGLWSGTASRCLRADGFSGLAGKDLTFVRERETIGEFFRFGKNKLAGEITRIAVTDDAETRLRVRIEYTGYADCEFECAVLDGNRSGMDDFHGAALKDADGLGSAGTANYEVTLDPAYNRSREIACSFLEVRVVRAKGAGQLVKEYALPKRWRTQIPVEDLLIPVTLKALKTAAALPPAGPVTVPERPPVAPPPAQPVPPRPVIAPLHPVVRVEAAKPASPRAPLAAAAPAVVRVSPVLAAPVVKQHIVTATTPVAQMLPQSRKLLLYGGMPRGLAQEDVQRGAQGPSSRQINLLEVFNPDVSLLAADISPVSLNIYLDKNPKSGICYFRPNGYNLAWDAEQGYGMRMLYKAASTDGQAGNVLVAARLDSGVDSGEVQLVKDLIAAYRARHADFAFTELRPLPVDEEPKVSLSSGLQRLFDVPADRIALTSLADALAEIQIQWVNDVTTLENIKAALKEEIGINGKIALTPSGGGLPAQEMPLQISIARPETFGFIPWKRGEMWRNPTLFPIRLKYLHALAIETNTPVVYTWSLNDAEIPAKARAAFRDGAVPLWLDGRVKKYWLQYSVRGSDGDAQKEVVEEITGGATAPTVTQLVFRTLKPISDSAAYQISARVRSRFFQARSQDVTEKSDLILDKDDKEFPAGSIYVSGRGPDEPLAEYTLSVVLPDGTVFPGTRWIAVTNTSPIFVGRVQLQQTTGHEFAAAR